MWRCTPIILAPWEAEAREWRVQGQLGLHALVYMIPDLRPALGRCQETNLAGMQNLRPLVTEKHRASPQDPGQPKHRLGKADEKEHGFQMWSIPLRSGGPHLILSLSYGGSERQVTVQKTEPKAKVQASLEPS